MLKVILALGVVFVVFLVYVALKPSDFVITRQIAINAPAEKIFPYINNSKLMDEWNPWSKIDTKAKMSFSGPEAGVGARTSWESSGQLGVGSCTIVESVPNQLVRSKLEYVKPFEMSQDALMKITPTTGGSVLEWTVSGKNSFMGRLMCTFMNMDKMVGGTFEKGLADLKSRLEKAP
jgi:uncharacterized protein YndB with AHSA1/START domain